ncbi:MAG: ATP-binding cassette domain-containing protein [Sedimentisphaerales bacterium]|nr:ATP-binding cassette domain-containing protein [Sedimentisphaerales bacterium]
MARFTVAKTFTWQGTFTDKVAQVCRVFALTEDWVRDRRETHNCTVEINQGDIVCITGRSGSGKSVLLRELEQCFDAEERINLNEIETPSDRTVVDCIEGDVYSTLRAISIAGLNDTMAVLNQPSNLSEGQKWRFRLAVAISTGRKYVFADEFCSNLSRVAASAIAYKVWKYAKRTGTTFIVAASAKDFLCDLVPDVIISKAMYEPAQVTYKDTRRQ